MSVLLALATVLMAWHADQWFADRLYAWQGHHWTLRFNFVTETLIHVLGRDLSTAAWLGVLAAWIVVRTRPGLSLWRRPLACLLVSTLLATALVAWVKSWSNMDCPWDLVRYGGDRAFVGLFGLRPVGMARGVCFPAGHASAGYAWMALYFFCLATRPRWRWAGLSVGVGLGVLFGFSQQLRGAHFLSHDLWTAAISWLTALGVHAFGWRESAVVAQLARAAATHAPPSAATGMAQPVAP
ncbi:phosphatase PAP2 family protein [Lysobacter koreensis]|uniref:Phosphatase PAP2 family protein n=1 Tax=Lysobacter koreensis TaxID=266122 RepID=A0ABW2YUI7_9GAMM